MDLVKTIETPYNNAVSVINKVNELLLENNIKDSTGETIAQLEITPANPAWLFALACGSLHTSWQETLSKAYSALDPANCEDDQVLVLATIAGLERGNGTPTHITVFIGNNDENNSVTIPLGTVFEETYTNHLWATNKAVTLLPGASQYVTLYSTVDGAITLPSGVEFTNDSFDTVSVTSSSASVKGEDLETIASLRNRLVQGVETSDAISQAVTAIERLSGIEQCSIWFNSDIATSMNVGNKVIPARTAYVSIKGVDVSGGLAEAYYTYLNVPATVGDNQEIYQRGLQALTVNFDIAELVNIPVYVTLRASDMADGAAERVRELINAHSGTLDCGQNVTSQMVSEWLKDFDYGTVLATYVNTADGYISNIEPNQYVGFNNSNIFVVGV